MGTHEDPQPRAKSQRRLTVVLIVVAGVVLLFTGLTLLFWEAAAVPPAPPPAVQEVTGPPPVLMAEPPVDPDQAPAPGMDPKFAPPDGPALDMPPFDVDAHAMRDELRTHGVETPDDMLYMLVLVADKYIAESDPDLDAWDPRIMRDVRTMWPDMTRQQRIDVTRCTAEYIERVIARNNGWPHPPDEDDHNDDTPPR